MKFRNSKQTINYLALLLVLFLSLNLNISCEKGTDPEQLKPGRRDYVWTEDTLDIQLPNMLTFRHIVGNSPDDIWVGTLDASYDVSLWHYDGNKWETVFFPGYATSALWLFEDNTLLVGTLENKIWKRENGEWTEPYILELEGFDRINIFDFYAETKNNIYAVGCAVNLTDNNYKSIILHFDGNSWDFVNIPEIAGVFHQMEFDKNSNLFFIYGTSDERGNFIESIYTFNGLETVKTTIPDIGFSLSAINKEIYINFSNQKIYKYRNNSFELWKDFSGTDFQTSFEGRNESDFFNNSSRGLGHYNGIDYKTIYETHLELQARIVFEKEIFVLADDYDKRKYIVLHGKLKE